MHKGVFIKLMETSTCMACFNLHSTFPSGHISLCPAEPRAGNWCPKGLTCPVSQRKCDGVGTGTQVLLLLRFLLYPEIEFPTLKIQKWWERGAVWLIELRSYFKTWGSGWFWKCPNQNRKKKMYLYIWNDLSESLIWESWDFLNATHSMCRYAKGKGKPLTSQSTFWGQWNEHINLHIVPDSG